VNIGGELHMKQKPKNPYDKIIMAIIALMLLAGLFTPCVTGYVNNATTIGERDMQSTIFLENVLSRLERKGEIRLTKGLSADVVEAKIKGFLGSIPLPKQQGYFYCMNVNTGKVNLKQTKGFDEIIINQVKGD
jgi:hypothetical protein